MHLLEYIYEPWPWYVAGPIIAGIMFSLIYAGKTFGMSSNLRTLCSIGGAGKWADFFRIDWKSQQWNLMVLIGAVLGGWLSARFLTKDSAVDISPGSRQALENIGFSPEAKTYLPSEIFGWEALSSPRGFLILLAGGFLVGFGARYAGGCTSGHAISGLSNLQLPSLQATVGFFIGGLVTTHLILPHLF